MSPMCYRVQSVQRGIDVLRAVAGGPRSVTEIATVTFLAKGTAFRLLASWSYRQFVVKEPRGTRYVLGPGLLPLMQDVRSTFGWIGMVGAEPLQKLLKLSGETVIVHVRIGLGRICVEELPSPHDLKYTASVGAMTPIYVGSAGKVLLASLDPEQLEKVMSQLRLRAMTDNTITARAELRRTAELTRAQGWAESEGERIHGAVGISVPVAIPGLTAALSILGPAERLSAGLRMEYLPQLQRAATEIERRADNSSAGVAA